MATIHAVALKLAGSYPGTASFEAEKRHLEKVLRMDLRDARELLNNLGMRSYEEVDALSGKGTAADPWVLTFSLPGMADRVDLGFQSRKEAKKFWLRVVGNEPDGKMHVWGPNTTVWFYLGKADQFYVIGENRPYTPEQLADGGGRVPRRAKRLSTQTGKQAETAEPRILHEEVGAMGMHEIATTLLNGQKVAAEEEDDEDEEDLEQIIKDSELGEEFGLAGAKEIAADLGIPEDEIGDVTLDGDGSEDDPWRLEDGSQEWVGYKDYDTLEAAAKARIIEDLENEPELFNQDWLSGYFEMSDTDRRVMANDEADSRVEGMDDMDLIQAAGLEDEYDELESDEDRESMVDGARDTLLETYYDEVYDALEDPVGYFVEQQGIYESAGDLLKYNIVGIDYEQASDDAIATDGAEHFIGTYDGSSTESYEYSVWLRVN